MTAGHAQVLQPPPGPGGKDLVDIPPHPVPDNESGIGQDVPGAPAQCAADQDFSPAGQDRSDPGGGPAFRGVHLSGRMQGCSIHVVEQEPGGIVEQGGKPVIVGSKTNSHNRQSWVLLMGAGCFLSRLWRDSRYARKREFISRAVSVQRAKSKQLFAFINRSVEAPARRSGMRPESPGTGSRIYKMQAAGHL